VLEQRLSRQRKLIADLKTRGLDASFEQSELARLLSELDTVLGKPRLEFVPGAAAS
jgi:arginine repressor